MVTKTVAAQPTMFPDVPPREDMQNSRQLYMPSRLPALRARLREIENLKPPDQRRFVYVDTEMPVRPLPTLDSVRLFVPDLTVAFDVDEETIERDNGYAIEHQGKPPEFVLEVASETTGTRDYTVKRDGYASFGISEYWRADPSGGEWHDAPLAGDRLADDGGYAPISIERLDENILRGYSAVLGLYVCWEHGYLNFYDPEAGYLLTYEEEREGRLTAEARAQAELERADAAEAERDEERDERLAESARADAAEARARQLEEELRRLQE